MRKKLALGLGLLAVVLTVTAMMAVPVSVSGRMPTAESRLQVGMEQVEVRKFLGECTDRPVNDRDSMVEEYEPDGTDWLGYQQTFIVRYKLNRRAGEAKATGWTVQTSHTTPPWLDRAMMWAGW